MVNFITFFENMATVERKKELNLLHCICMTVGTMIGSGIFASPSVVYDNAGSVGMGLLIWSFSGVLSLLASLSYVELGLMYKQSGGEIVYIFEAFGSCMSFMVTWVLVFIAKPATYAAISLVCSSYILNTFQVDSDTQQWLRKVIAFSIIALLTLINCFSIRVAKTLQVIFTASNIIAIVILIIIGIVRLIQGFDSNFKQAFDGTSTDFGNLSYSFYGCLLAYNGWNNLSFVLSEVKKPVRNMRLATLIGIPFVTVCYILVNIGYLTVVSISQLKHTKTVAMDVARQLIGKYAWSISVLIAFATMGSVNGGLFSLSRVINKSAQLEHLPRFLEIKEENEAKGKSPVASVLLMGGLSVIMLIPESSSFFLLLKYSSFVNWLMYGTAMAALLWLRYKQPNHLRPFKIFIAIPIIVLLCSIYLVVAPFYNDFIESMYGLAIVVSGIPVYLIFVSKLTEDKRHWLVTSVREKLQIFLPMIQDITYGRQISTSPFLDNRKKHLECVVILNTAIESLQNSNTSIQRPKDGMEDTGTLFINLESPEFSQSRKEMSNYQKQYEDDC